jgi:hypothetical protein
MPLTAQVKQWATPTVHERMEPPHQWQASNIKKKAENPKLGTLHKPLGTMVMEQKQWPTPASSGVTGGATGLAGGTGNRQKLASMLPEAEAKAMGCGKLNPRWVETLMGLPVGWTMPSCASPVTIAPTSFDSSGTASSQPPQNAPSAS